MSTELTEMQQMANMARGLQNSAQEAAEDSAGFMKFTKFGNWVFGTESAEVEDDSVWAVHPQGFRHGWIAWGNEDNGNQGEKLGEVTVPASSPLPLKSDLDDVKGTWSQQVSMQLLCIEGFDKGTRVVYNCNSVGGRKAYQKVVNAVVSKISSGATDVAPVVALDKESYKHKKYGLIYNPIIVIEDYLTLEELKEYSEQSPEGENNEKTEAVEKKAEQDTPKTEPEPAAEPETKPRARRTRRAK